VEVVGIDLSETSLASARAFAQDLGVGENLTLRRLAIEDAGALDGSFDYVIASGVLHHLADPDAGLRALAGKLSPTGGFGILLYATYGRQPVYMVQGLLRRLIGGEPLETQVGLTRRLLASWPVSNPFRPKDWMDLDWDGDAGLVDLLLHAQDRSYTVPELIALLEGAGLRLDQFFDPVAYDPAAYTADPDLARVMSALPPDEQATVAELLHGAMRKHMFFATRASYRPVRVAPEGLALMALRPKRSPLFDWENARTRGKRREQQFVVRQHPFDTTAITAELSAWNAVVVRNCGGELTSAEVFDIPEVQAAVPGATPAEKLDSYGRFMERMASIRVLLFDL
jgi:Methyltransferase domain